MNMCSLGARPSQAPRLEYVQLHSTCYYSDRFQILLSYMLLSKPLFLCAFDGQYM